MAYIGRQLGQGVRNRFIYTATAGQTTFSGSDDNGSTLVYTDGMLWPTLCLRRMVGRLVVM